MPSIGIYPGTFDPIHKGHLSFALETIKLCKLDQVIFLPERLPRSKVRVSPIVQRVQQIKSTIQHYPILDVELLESSPFSIYETLPEIQKLFANNKLTLLIGSDIALHLHKWDGIAALLKACDIAVGMRSDQSEAEVRQLLEKLLPLCPSTNLTIVKTNYPTLASSAFRNQIKKLG